MGTSFDGASVLFARVSSAVTSVLSATLILAACGGTSETPSGAGAQTGSPAPVASDPIDGEDGWEAATPGVIAQPDDARILILSGICNGDVRAEAVSESATSIEVALWVRGGTVDDCGQGIFIDLAAPLGDRTVVDHATGQSVPVRSE